MGLPQFKSCCCGCTLRTGTLILLWLHLIPCIMSLLSYAVIFFEELMKAGLTWDLFIIVLRYLAGFIVTAVIMAGLYGVYKDRYSYLIPFLSYIGSAAVLPTIVLLALFIISDKERVSVASVVSSELVIAAFINFALNAYFWLVVYSYYQVVKKLSLSRNIPFDAE